MMSKVSKPQALVSALLGQELESRKEKNRRYSLRTFAKSMGISPSFLSDVLKGKRGIRETKAREIALRLGWSLEETERFTSAAGLKYTFDKATSELLQSKVRNQNRVFYRAPMTHLSRLNRWYHDAIVELTYTKGFRSDAAWISKRLGIKETEAQRAIADLKRAGLLELKKGRLVKTQNNTVIPDHPSDVLKRLHLESLELARNSILHHPEPTRYTRGMTMAIDPKKLAEANRRMSAFLRELMTFLEEGERTSVYHLALQLFPLTP
jgi:uncharacterized protein (TIGR02147 family)